MLDDQTFKTVVDSTPLISIDIILKKGNKVLLGKRVNKPAQGYFFSIGGRINKNETINNAMVRIALDELNIDLKLTSGRKHSWVAPKFIGVFEHFYDDSIFENISTHYINLAYEVEVVEIPDLPTDQHNEYQWLTIDELLESKQVHKYVKDCFKD